jgi:hypothetical protein
MSGQGNGGRSRITNRLENFIRGRAGALTARANGLRSFCELVFECDRACSASAELRSE